MSHRLETVDTTPAVADAVKNTTPQGLLPDWKSWHAAGESTKASSPYDSEGNLANIYKSVHHQETSSVSGGLKGKDGGSTQAEIPQVGGHATTFTFNPKDNQTNAEYAADLRHESRVLAPYMAVQTTANAVIFGGKAAWSRGLLAGGGLVEAELLAANGLAQNHRDVASFLKPSVFEAAFVGSAAAFGSSLRARAGLLIGAALVGKGVSTGLDYAGKWMDRRKD